MAELDVDMLREYRGCNGRVFVIENDGIIIGLALVREFTDEPKGYELQQFIGIRFCRPWTDTGKTAHRGSF